MRKRERKQEKKKEERDEEGKGYQHTSIVKGVKRTIEGNSSNY